MPRTTRSGRGWLIGFQQLAWCEILLLARESIHISCDAIAVMYIHGPNTVYDLLHVPSEYVG